MKSGVAATALSLAMMASAFAAPRPMSQDQSGSFLIDAASAAKIWKDNTPARVSKLYPAKRFRFVSEVAGGFTDSKSCVVTARAMLLPMQGSKVVYAPIKAATAFDAVPNLTNEQCQDLAKSKLKEAVQSVAASLVAS